MFHYRTTPHEFTGRAPCELLMGRMLKTPLDVLHPDLRKTALQKQLKQKLNFDRGCRPDPLPEPGTPVFAKNFRPGSPWVPGHVTSATSASSVSVRLDDGTMWHRHGDHIRPNRTEAAVAPEPGTGVTLEPLYPSATSESPTSPGVVITEEIVPAATSSAGATVTPKTASRGGFQPDSGKPSTETVVTPTPPRRSTRTRRPVLRYSPG